MSIVLYQACFIAFFMTQAFAFNQWLARCSKLALRASNVRFEKCVSRMARVQSRRSQVDAKFTFHAAPSVHRHR